GATGEAGQVGVVPAFLHPRESKLHAADVRDDLELILAQAVAEVAGHPVKQGVATADQDRVPGPERLSDLPEGGGHFGLERGLSTLDPFQEPEGRKTTLE